MKIKNEIICPYCATSDVIKYGKKDGTGQQRYRCKNENCRRTFILESDKKRHWYTSKEKAFLTMLLELIEPLNTNNIDICEVIKNINESKYNFSEINFEQKEVKNDTIQCFQPKILICKDCNDIKIYRFNPRQDRHVEHREIKILDNNKFSKNLNSVLRKKNTTRQERFKNNLRLERSVISEEEMLEHGLYDDRYEKNNYWDDF